MTFLNPFFQYALVTQLLGSVVLQMKKNTHNGLDKRLKLDGKNGCLYYDNAYGRIYVGHKDMYKNYHTNMIDDSLITLLELNDITPRELEASQDLQAIWGTETAQDTMSVYGAKRKGCEFCNGYGIWPDDEHEVPVLPNEVSWALADPCVNCGSHNHTEYMNQSGPFDPPPWVNKTIGFHAALEKFNRSIGCVES